VAAMQGRDRGYWIVRTAVAAARSGSCSPPAEDHRPARRVARASPDRRDRGGPGESERMAKRACQIVATRDRGEVTTAAGHGDDHDARVTGELHDRDRLLQRAREDGGRGAGAEARPRMASATGVLGRWSGSAPEVGSPDARFVPGRDPGGRPESSTTARPDQRRAEVARASGAKPDGDRTRQ